MIKFLKPPPDSNTANYSTMQLLFNTESFNDNLENQFSFFNLYLTADLKATDKDWMLEFVTVHSMKPGILKQQSFQSAEAEQPPPPQTQQPPVTQPISDPFLWQYAALAVVISRPLVQVWKRGRKFFKVQIEFAIDSEKSGKKENSSESEQVECSEKGTK